MCQAAVIGVTSGLTAPEVILPYLKRALRHTPSATITVLCRLREWGLSWAQTTVISDMLEAVHSLVEEDCPRLSRMVSTHPMYMHLYRPALSNAHRELTWLIRTN